MFIYTLRVRDYHPLRSSFPEYVPLSIYMLLGSTAFARHYLRYNYCSLFLRLLRCFSSPGCLPLRDYRSSTCRVAPFGHLRINARLQLPVAFRSLPRPSSSLRAKASTIRSYLLPILIFLLLVIIYKLLHLYTTPSRLHTLLFVFLLFYFLPPCQ
jgi:hypothetical protein